MAPLADVTIITSLFNVLLSEDFDISYKISFLQWFTFDKKVQHAWRNSHTFVICFHNIISKHFW